MAKDRPPQGTVCIRLCLRCQQRHVSTTCSDQEQEPRECQVVSLTTTAPTIGKSWAEVNLGNGATRISIVWTALLHVLRRRTVIPYTKSNGAPARPVSKSTPADGTSCENNCLAASPHTQVLSNFDAHIVTRSLHDKTTGVSRRSRIMSLHYCSHDSSSASP